MNGLTAEQREDAEWMARNCTPHQRETVAALLAAYDSQAAALAERDAEIAKREREIFDAGFNAAVGYGDNFIHYRGEQADRVFAKSMEALSQASGGG